MPAKKRPVAKKKGQPMTLSEAGRLGGNKRKKSLGEKGYQKLGQKGGAKVLKKYGPDFYSKIGKKGGEVRKKELGHTGYVKLGKLRAEQSRRIEQGRRGGRSAS